MNPKKPFSYDESTEMRPILFDVPIVEVEKSEAMNKKLSEESKYGGNSNLFRRRKKSEQST